MASLVDAARNTIAENFGGLATKLATDQFSLDQVPDQAGKVALVTGGSEGIGYAITHTLLKYNISKVFVVSVSEPVAQEARETITRDLGQDKADRMVWIQADLANWSKIKPIVDQVQESTDRLDILVNNAARGIMTAQLTDYGVDRHMAINHFAGIILISYLLPLMKKTAEKGDVVRIVNQASNAHQGAPSDTKFTSLEELNQDSGPNGQYGRSKLAEILTARYFAKKVTDGGCPNVLMNATHPGFVSTKQSKEDIHEPYPVSGYVMSKGMEPLKKDQFDGATSAVFAATLAKESGQYICVPAVVEAGSDLSQDEKLGEQLMKLTREVVREKGSGLEGLELI